MSTLTYEQLAARVEHDIRERSQKRRRSNRTATNAASQSVPRSAP